MGLPVRMGRENRANILNTYFYSLPASRDVMGNNEEGQPGDQIAAGGGDSLAAGGASRHRAGRGQWHRYPGGRAGT